MMLRAARAALGATIIMLGVLGSVLVVAFVFFGLPKRAVAPVIPVAVTPGSSSTEATEQLFPSFAATTTPESSNVITILFTGDMMFDRHVADRSKAAGSLAYPFARIGDLFQGHDLVVANLEGPVTAVRRPPVKEIDFAFDPKIPRILKSVGVDVVSQANNHTLDQGRAGAEDSRTYLRDAGVAFFGDEVHDDVSSSLVVLTRNGQRIALLGFNITEGPLNRADALNAITTAKRSADHVIVFMHWGQEYHDVPNATQVDLAHWFIDNGVEAVIGGHPHWVQSVERYHGHLIAYSLGNFIFDQDFSAETDYGLTVELTLRSKGDEMTLKPIRITSSQPHVLEGADRNARLQTLADISDPSLRSQILSGTITSQ